MPRLRCASGVGYQYIQPAESSTNLIEGLLNLPLIVSNQEIIVADAKGRIVSQVRRDADDVARAIYAQDVKLLDVTRRVWRGQDTLTVIEPTIPQRPSS